MLNIDMYAAVQTAISQENDKSLNELKLRLNEEYCGATKMSREEFLSLLLKDETSLSREFSAEIYIPKIVRKQHEDKGNVCMALRSEVSGNCLYSSVSLLLAGDNSLLHILRQLTSLELFLNATFYCQHPLFSSIVEQHKEFNNTSKNILPLTVSQDCLDSGFVGVDLVKRRPFELS
ncbi:uncharacterized protein LOC124441595 [Xenia sp. Carnegie-2017]|uniref:uncharacterized protein LOC124441595 n=1 Tax=Xenia sp. Carnegie-2017 TaxID=2897299 RepID=UPI001F044ABC|nr:uncharacterized protein LOC124441595 [Xenia sp. Carnegie-2017]